MTPMTPVTSMTLSRRRAVLSAAILTGLPLLGPPAPARAEGTDINLKEWTLIDSLSDGFDAPLDSARWHRGLWYPTSGVGAFRDENAEVSDGVLRLWARAEGSGGGGGASHTFGAVESVFDTPGVCSYVEVRARALPSAARVLSAVWLQSSTLSGENALAADPNPEIDVQETFDFHAMTSATHIWPGGNDAGHRSFGGHTYPTADDVSSDYHFYGVERREGEVLIYWDRHLAWRLPAPDPSLWRMSRHVVLSLEGHLGRVQDSALPASFDIDYVRTYYRTPPGCSRTGTSASSTPRAGRCPWALRASCSAPPPVRTLAGACAARTISPMCSLRRRGPCWAPSPPPAMRAGAWWPPPGRVPGRTPRAAGTGGTSCRWRTE